MVQCMFSRPKLQRFTASHQIYRARMCHLKDSVEEKGSFDEEEITLFPSIYFALQTAEEIHPLQCKGSKL